ncbi:hypothetical protein FOCG_18078 [Fusarium oxysporum f. sp. radicis-lycopersici 26381]|nr:hypothetical protein FOWG_16946 [Fusarium oxysporum f. sp. lycopersici MN25]EXL39307.1 hypothetical protein FOCG_18078 [Fusarium oxysporum f. sp. radicis-lycopersici 26381]
MSEKEKELDAALNKIQTLLNDLPTNYPIERLEELEKNLSSKLALVQLHRDWQQGSLEGIQHQNIRSRMRKYFGYAYPHKRKTKSESATKRETKKDGQIREELKKHGIRPQLLNSVSYKLENINKLKLEFVEKAPFEELATKFLESRWNAEFQETANSIMKDPHYETEELLEDFEFFVTEIQSKLLGPTEEPVHNESTQVPRQQSTRKRNWDGDIGPTAQSSPKRMRASTDARDKALAAENTTGYWQENNLDVQHLPVSFSVTQDTEHPHTGSRIIVSKLTENLKPVQSVAVSDLENNRAHGQAKVPTAENTVGYLQENHSDVGHLTVAPSFTQEPLGDIQPRNASDPANVTEQPRLLPSGQSPNRTFEYRNSDEMGCLIAQQTFALNLQTTTFQSGNDSIANVNMSEMMDAELGWDSWLGNMIIDSS